MAKKHKFDYFEAFCAQADIARRESQALLDVVENFKADSDWLRSRMEDIHAIENEGDDVAHEIMEHLATEFLPPIDREDVTELTMLLDDVTDELEEVVQHIYMYDFKELHPAVLPTARVIDAAVGALCEATKAFNEFKKPKKLEKLLVAVHDRESEGDELCDICEDVACVMQKVMLKNS